MFNAVYVDRQATPARPGCARGRRHRAQTTADADTGAQLSDPDPSPEAPRAPTPEELRAALPESGPLARWCARWRAATPS